MNMRTFLHIIFLGLPLFLASCGDDDLKKANAIAPGKITFTRERTVGVEIIYSDSAHVKAKGNAPIMDKVTPSNGGSYQEMPKGIKIDFYDVKTGKVNGTLVADYAIKKDQEQKTIFRKNVIVKNPQGSTFSSEELIWDEIKKIFYSTQRVYISDEKGENKGSGVDFEAPQDFSSYKFNSASGEFSQSPLFQ